MTICNCQTCKKDRRCGLQNDYARKALFAFGRSLPLPDCPDYQQDCWHGIDGVAPTHRSPLPERRPAYHRGFARNPGRIFTQERGA